MNIFGIELMGSQLILSIVIFYILFKTWHSYKTKQISNSFFVLWILLWLIGLSAIYYPGLLSTIAGFLNIGRGVDFALYVSIILIFYLIYKINIKIGKVNRDLTKIVRKLTIEKNI